MDSSLKFIALVVPDLRAAEEYYRSVFDMQLIGREAQLEDGLWYTRPFDKGWDDAKSAGIELDVLALFSGDALQGQVFAIGLTLPPKETAGVRSRLPAGTVVDTDEPERLEFRDPYHITWQISPGDAFRTAGDFANRWIEL